MLNKHQERRPLKMSSLSSIVVPTLKMTSKDPVKAAEGVRDPLKSSDMNRKSQCDMCKLSYSTEKELLEHCLSLMHHTKLEDREENSLHNCTLCGVNCSNMTDYRRHITTDAHQVKLSDLRGDKDRKINGNVSRESIQTSRYSFPSKSGYGDAKLSSYNKQFQEDSNFHGNRIPVKQDAINSRFSRDHQQSSNFRFGQVNDNAPSQMWNRGLWGGGYPYKNDAYHWSRESYMDQEPSMSRGGKGHLKTQEEQHSNEQSDLVSGGYYGYSNSGGYSKPRRWENGQEKMNINDIYHNKDLKQIFEDPSEMDFTIDVLPNDWDDQSILESEQFLACMDGGYLSGKHHSHRVSKTVDIDRWDESSSQDRKRPRNGDDIHELLAKSPKSIGSSSDEGTPARDVPRRHLSLFGTPSTQANRPAPSAPISKILQSKVSPIDDASNNILERAESLCKELREKREASQVQRSLLLKKQEHESLNQRMSTLVEKQQLYLKGHIIDSKQQLNEERNGSGMNISLNQQFRQNGILTMPVFRKLPVGSGANASQHRATGKTLDEIKKSAVKNVLEKSQTNLKNSAGDRTVQKSLSGEDAGFGKSNESKDMVLGLTGKPLLKFVSKPHLTKDSLKKMVNTPNSRDERLQLIKMLQSREEQKVTTNSAPRTSVHLEGLYDSVFTSKDMDFDIGQNGDTQAIKLEDLSESVRQQILDLIGGDVSGQFESQSILSTKSPVRLAKKSSTSHADLIVLSDDEDLKGKNKNKKNSTKKMLNLNTPIILDDVTRINNKKKTFASSVFKDGVKNSVSSLLKSQAVLKSPSVNHSGNLRPSSPVHHLFKALKNTTSDTDRDVQIVSCSSDKKIGKKKDTLPRKATSLDTSRTVLVDKQNFSISSTNSKQRTFSNKEVRSHLLSSATDQSQLNSSNVKDKFPTLLNIYKADRMSPVKKNGTNILSNIQPAHRSSEQYVQNADKNSNMEMVSSSILTTLRATSPTVEVRPSLVQTAQEATISEISQSWSSAQTAQTQKSHKLVLPSNTWLTYQTSPPGSYEHQRRTSSDRSFDLLNKSFTAQVSSSDEDPKNNDITSANIIVADDIDHSKEDNVDLPDSRVKPGPSTFIDGTSSQTMSKLLVLSEKEENVKQEKMNMDLRLSRLHRLLEQAVVQINKCTDRMNQLHEEEQDLLKKRLSLLRVATSVRPSWRSDASDNNTTLPSESTSHAETGQNSISNLASNKEATSFSNASQRTTSSVLPASAHTSCVQTSPDKTENPQGTSLSRADWLAKFSSYLPHDQAIGGNNKTGARSFSLSISSSPVNDQPYILDSSQLLDGTCAPLSHLNSVPSEQLFLERDTLSHQVTSIGMKNQDLHEKSSLKSGLYGKSSQTASGEDAAESNKRDVELHSQVYSMVTSTTTSSTTASVGEQPSIHNLITAPIMYVGSFRSADRPVRMMAPVVLERSSTESVLKKPRTDIHQHLDRVSNLTATRSPQRRDSGDISTRNSAFTDLLHLSSPPRSHIMIKGSEHGGEESDIGSVASSIASGSSLGEQITRYCRATPGASLEPFGAHELSVIMSDTSEQRGLDSQEEEEDHSLKQDDWYKIVRDCSVSLERVDTNSRKNIYGNLDENAIKSAEAFHLLERNYEDIACPSNDVSDSGKRKKRKTKQERDTSGFSRRRRHWIILSSSEEDENGKSKKVFDLDDSIAAPQVTGNSLSSGNEKNYFCALQSNVNNTSDGTRLAQQSPSKGTSGSDVTMTNIEFTSPSKAASNINVTVAECDSSTSFDIVDSESITLRANNLKEMRDSFEQKSGLFSKSSSPDSFSGINSSTTDGIMIRNGSVSSRPELSLSYLGTMKRSSQFDSSQLASITTVTTASNSASGRTTSVSGLPVYSTIDLTRSSTSPDLKSELSSNYWKASPKTSHEINKHNDLPARKNASRFPGDYGPVFDISIVRGHLYVGHVNRAVRVYSLCDVNRDKLVKEYYFPYLQCMSVSELDGTATLILGNGSDLLFCNSNEERNLKYNLGTTIKCLLSLYPLVYAGLDTGEICIFDTLRMAVRDRCICSDHPIHCLASGQEGTVKLLCVSSQDGTIIIVNAHQCLPIRILTGHTKTAFSIQVEGHLVFSGSGDHTVLIQNLHSAAVEHVYKESKGLVKSVYYNQGYLFTGGMDKLVRCYNVKTHQLVQVYFGADRGVITKIFVLGDLLITGSIAGSVDIVEIDVAARHECHVSGCGLNFGKKSHLSWHEAEDHNIAVKAVVSHYGTRIDPQSNTPVYPAVNEYLTYT